MSNWGSSLKGGMMLGYPNYLLVLYDEKSSSPNNAGFLL